MKLLRRAGRALASTSGPERTLYTVAMGYGYLAVLVAIRDQNVSAVVGYASCVFLAILCALTARAAHAASKAPEVPTGPLDGRGCVVVAFHGGPLDGGTGMVSHSHEPGARVDQVVVPVDGGRYVAVDVESTLYRLEFEAEEATV